MPLLNGEKHLEEQLAALASQTYAGEWELVVADNGCTDRSLEIIRGWSDRLHVVRVADARGRRGINHARNVGAHAARGDFLAFCDADDVAVPGWLDALVGASSGGDIVGGPLDLSTLNDERSSSWRPTDRVEDLPDEHGFLPYAPGGNCGMWASVARDVQWNEDFHFGSSDIDFSWRAQLRSYRLCLAPGAVMQLRFRSRLRELAHQYYRYGRSGPQLYRKFRSLGMPRARRSETLEAWRSLLVRPRQLLRSHRRRGSWVRIAAFRLGRLVGSLRFGVVFL